jgi:hypothetical protein
MPNETPSHCQVSNLDLFFMILGYVRYAMGRMSTAPSSAQDFIKKYGDHLTDHQISQIANEIEEGLGFEERTRGRAFLESNVDHLTWKETLEIAKNQLALRS